jgi:hypothetical protein
MKPLVEGLEKTYGSTVEFRRLNVESDQDAISLAEKLGVQYVPTFLFVNADGVVAKTVVGGMSLDALSSAVASLK